MAIKFGVNLATLIFLNPLHHHLYLPPTSAAVGISGVVFDRAGRSGCGFAA